MRNLLDVYRQEQPYHGPITKQARSSARWLAVEAEQSLSQMSTPHAATYHRVKRKRGHNVAVTALARKLVVLVWYWSVTRTSPSGVSESRSCATGGRST